MSFLLVEGPETDELERSAATALNSNPHLVTFRIGKSRGRSKERISQVLDIQVSVRKIVHQLGGVYATVYCSISEKDLRDRPQLATLAYFFIEEYDLDNPQPAAALQLYPDDSLTVT